MAADQKGFVDDTSIPDTSELWRRIPPRHFYADDNESGMRPSSAAFEDDPDGGPLSVFLAAEALAPQHVLEGHEGYALAALTAGFARANCQIIARDPRPGPPGHALVVGRKTHGTRKKFARQARWVVSPSAGT